MKLHRAYEFELKTSTLQEKELRHFAECTRRAYNHALRLLSARWESGQRLLRYAELCRLLTAWRHSPELEMLKDAPGQVLQQALKDLDRAFQTFYSKKAGFPKPRKNHVDRFRYPAYFKLDQQSARVYLPKIGWLKYRRSCDIEGIMKQVTVRRDIDRWKISIMTEREIPTPVHRSRSSIGIDMGVVKFATLSDGTSYAPVNSYKKHQERLAKAQRELARKQKYGKNWEKQRLRVERIHRTIRRVRHDYLHKLSNHITDRHSLVVVEDLKVRQLSNSGARTHSGHRLRRRSKLNKSILDQGWAEFRRQLQYKALWRGGRIIAVPPQNTSRTCSVCGYVAASNRKSQAEFECGRCGWIENADLNAAKNILAAGHVVMACEANGAVTPSAAGTNPVASNHAEPSAL